MKDNNIIEIRDLKKNFGNICAVGFSCGSAFADVLGLDRQRLVDGIE